MNNIASEINNGLGAFKALYHLGKMGYVKARNRFSTPLRVEKLADDIFSYRIKYGCVVTVEGVLSRYSTTYRPTTYAPSIPAQSLDKRVSIGRDPKTGKLFEKRQTEAKFKLFQFPVQALPKYKDEKSIFYVAFLYPSNFDSFLLDEDKNKDKEDKKGDRLLINSRHRPIPVLVTAEAIENYSESLVTLTGIVSLIPESLVSEFTNNICKTRENFYNHFFRPYSEKFAFCIDCRDSMNSDLSLKSRLEKLPAALYVEGHFEGILDEKYKNEFKKSIPQGLYWDFAYKSYPGISFYLTAHDTVSVIGADPSIFGFYIEVDLANARALDSKIRQLEEFYTQFRKTAANRIRKNMGTEARFKPDFIFDFRKQFIFHPDGVLSSKELSDAIEENPSVSETATWLKSAK